MREQTRKMMETQMKERDQNLKNYFHDQLKTLILEHIGKYAHENLKETSDDSEEKISSSMRGSLAKEMVRKNPQQPLKMKEEKISVVFGFSGFFICTSRNLRRFLWQRKYWL